MDMNEYTGTVYSLRNKKNNKEYIGLTLQTLEERIMHHKSHAKKGSYHINKAIREYGIENFEPRVLFTYSAPTKKEVKSKLRPLEIKSMEWNISYFPFGYNHNKPANGKNHTEESKKLMSESTSGEKNPQYGKKGKDSPNWGKKHRKESLQLMSEKMSGENNPMFGKSHTEEWKQNMSKRFSGENNPFYGKQLSLDHRNKISESRKGKCVGNNNPRRTPEVIENEKIVMELTEQDKGPKEIEEITGIPRTKVSNIKACYYRRLKKLQNNV